jgi:RHS repeat-associated protein
VYTLNYFKTRMYAVLRVVAAVLVVLMTVEVVPGAAWAEGIHDGYASLSKQTSAIKEQFYLDKVQAQLRWQVAHTKNLDPMRFAGTAHAMPLTITINGATTILDEVGRLREPVPTQTVSGWRTELTSLEKPHITLHPDRAAQLHLFLGEYELAQDHAPNSARDQFQQARELALPTSGAYTRALYDDAMALFYEGAYEDSEDAFAHVLHLKGVQQGFDMRCAGAMLRHASACWGYHADHARIGIPEPPVLDKFCAAAAFANSLKALGVPWDRASVLKVFHVNGEGSTMQDVIDAGAKLGLPVHMVRADDTGLKMLPMPLVTWIEGDHFVSVVKADKAGVDYLCSDCGAWPGGRVHLTWKQWDTMSGDIVAVVSRPNTTWDRQLASLPLPTTTVAPSEGVYGAMGVQVASAGSLNGLGIMDEFNALRLLRHVAITALPPCDVGCGVAPASCPCPTSGCPVCPSCPMDSGGAGSGTGGPGGASSGSGTMGSVSSSPSGASSGPSSGDPVELATGEEDYQPGPDLTVYNPNGPAVAWQRIYGSMHSITDAWYEPYDFGSGWSTLYNVGVQDASSGGAGQKYLYMYNGLRISVTAPSVPSSSNPAVACTVATGYPILAQWDYNSSTGTNFFTITFANRTQWITTSENSATNCYMLYEILTRNYSSSDPTQNVITFNYATGLEVKPYVVALWPLLTSIIDGSGNPLLVINRATDGTGNITSVEDRYGRMVFYHVGYYRPENEPGGVPDTSPDLDEVSQVVQGFPASAPPDRYSFGYTECGDDENAYELVPYLSSISVPSPTGTGASTASIEYTTSGFVSQITDGNGNTRVYESVTSSGSADFPSNYEKVTVTGPGTTSSYAYTVNYDNNMNGLTRTDGGDSTIPDTNIYGDADNPYSVTKITDANGYVTENTYDSRGNGHLIERDTRFSGTPGASGTEYLASVYTYSYANFGLGEVTQSQDRYMLTGSPPTVVTQKSPATYAYFEPSGNVESVTRPQPGTVDSSSTVTYSMTYDALGDMAEFTSPGNNAVGSISLTYSYGSAPAVGQATEVTDALGHSIQFSYDAQGDKAAQIDAAGNETDYSYEDPNTNNGGVIVGQLQSTTYPPTTSIPTNRAKLVTTYLYPGGPKLADVTYSESGSEYREVNYTYGLEGEELSTTGSTESAYYTYDDLYRRATLADGNGNTTRYYYNAHGYLNATTYPGYAGSTPTWSSSAGDWTGTSGADSTVYGSYDGIGDVISRVDGRGVTTAYTYSDPGNLLTNVHYTLPSSPPAGLVGTPDVNFTYDDYGRASTVDNGVVRTTYGPTGTNGYDDDDNVLSVQTGYYSGSSILFNATASYTYFPDDGRATMTAPSGTFNYYDDAAGRMTSLTNPFGEATSWTYGSNNWLASQTDDNSSGSLVSTASYAYDERGFLTDLANTNSTGRTLSEFGSTNPTYAMTYDAMGNRTVMAVNDAVATGYSGTTDYSYDSRNELTQEASTRNGDYTNNFAYDGAENPTTFRSASMPAANPDNQIAVSGYYAYDGSGNPTTYNSANLVFDPENRMTSYGTVLSCGYTPDGLRAWKQNSSGTTYFLYDGKRPVCELSSSGAVTATYTFGSNGLISRNVSGASKFYSFDPQGTTAQRLSSTSSVLTSGMSDAYGASVGGSATDPFSGYCSQYGYYTDAETGLLLLGHRFYDPALGRFINRDPIGALGGVNLYAYCHNAVTALHDASGYAVCDELLTFLACIGTFCAICAICPVVTVPCCAIGLIFCFIVTVIVMIVCELGE